LKLFKFSGEKQGFGRLFKVCQNYSKRPAIPVEGFVLIQERKVRGFYCSGTKIFEVLNLTTVSYIFSKTGKLQFYLYYKRRLIEGASNG
jgi:hypothetical protein